MGAGAGRLLRFLPPEGESTLGSDDDWLLALPLVAAREALRTRGTAGMLDACLFDADEDDSAAPFSLREAVLLSLRVRPVRKAIVVGWRLVLVLLLLLLPLVPLVLREPKRDRLAERPALRRS